MQEKIIAPFRIRMIPTHFNLEVWVGDSEELLEAYNNRYGLDREYLGEGELAVVRIGDNAIIKEDVFAMKIPSFLYSAIVHELVHLMYALEREIGLEVGTKNQEWQAYFMEYMFDEILKFETDD